MPTFWMKKRGFEDRLRTARDALRTRFPKDRPLPFNGKDLGALATAEKLDLVLTRFEAVRVAKLEWQRALQELHAALPGARALLETVRVALVAALGGQTPELALYGFAQKARRKLTVFQKAAKSERQRQTRKLRHTMGKRARARIKAP